MCAKILPLAVDVLPLRWMLFFMTNCKQTSEDQEQHLQSSCSQFHIPVAIQLNNEKHIMLESAFPGRLQFAAQHRPHMLDFRAKLSVKWILKHLLLSRKYPVQLIIKWRGERGGKLRVVEVRKATIQSLNQVRLAFNIASVGIRRNKSHLAKAKRWQSFLF